MVHGDVPSRALSMSWCALDFVPCAMQARGRTGSCALTALWTSDQSCALNMSLLYPAGPPLRCDLARSTGALLGVEPWRRPGVVELLHVTPCWCCSAPGKCWTVRLVRARGVGVTNETHKPVQWDTETHTVTRRAIPRDTRHPIAMFVAHNRDTEKNKRNVELRWYF